MNRPRTIVAALALAFGAMPAARAADAPQSVTIYGVVDAGLVKRTGATVAIGKRDNNRLGFRASEDLGSGLAALVQLEIRFEPDTGTLESGVRPLFQGQSRVGLQGGFGTLRLGRGLTAFQESSAAFEPWSGMPTPAGFQTDLMIAGFNSDVLGPVGNSTNRMSNAVFYNSPVYAGAQLNVTVGTKEANGGPVVIGRGTAAAPQYPANSPASANPYSVSLTYQDGPLGAMAAYERNAVESTVWSLAASLKSGDALKWFASYQHQDRSHTMAANPDIKSWVLGVNYAVGAGKWLAGYGQKQPDGLPRVRQLSFGYEHSLSKRTMLYAEASNKDSGAAVKYFSSGIRHSF